jgi:hypothetical protein
MNVVKRAPFEWLSLPHLLISKLQEKIENNSFTKSLGDNKIYVIDLGSGSSLLSIELFKKNMHRIRQVVNLDYNNEALEIARSNLDKDTLSYVNQGIIQFHQINLAQEFSNVEYDLIFSHNDNHTSPMIVLDKSTLDCFLATPNIDDNAKHANYLPYLDAATMLLNAYNIFLFNYKNMPIMKTKKKTIDGENINKSGNGIILGSKYICCSYHEPEFLKPILSTLFVVENIEMVPRSDHINENFNEKNSINDANNIFKSSDPNFVYLYTCDIPGIITKTTNNIYNCKPIENIRSEIEEIVNYYYKHTSTYLSTMNVSNTKKKWKDMLVKHNDTSINDDETGQSKKLGIEIVYAIMIDENLKSMYSLKDFLGDWLSLSNGYDDHRNTEKINIKNVMLSYEEAIDFIKHIE